MRKKASIQLSINFLVTFIITIVVFGLGLILAKQIFSGSEGLADKTFDDLDKQIGSLVCSGSEKICFTAKQRRIERGEFGVIGLSVENVFPDPDGKDFFVTIELTKYVDSQGMEPPSLPVSDTDMGILPRVRKLNLASKETGSMGIGMEIPKDAPSGTYVFDVNVYYRNPDSNLNPTTVSYVKGIPGIESYTNNQPRKIYVKVP